MMDELDLAKLKFPQNIEFNTECKSLPRHKKGEKFLKGPIPENWLALAAQQPGKAFQLAVELWFQAGIERKATVKLSYEGLQRWGVKRNAAYRALDVLEKVNLISVKRHRGRSPVVTIRALMRQESEAL